MALHKRLTQPIVRAAIGVMLVTIMLVTIMIVTVSWTTPAIAHHRKPNGCGG